MDEKMYQKTCSDEAAAEAGFRAIFGAECVWRSPKSVNYGLERQVRFENKIDGKMYQKRVLMRQRGRRDFVLFLVPNGSGDP